MQRQANLIYEFTKKYVLNVLWENYQNILRNPQHHDDLIQSVWLKIFKEIENYDASKASITLFPASVDKTCCNRLLQRTFPENYCLLCKWNPESTGVH